MAPPPEAQDRRQLRKFSIPLIMAVMEFDLFNRGMWDGEHTSIRSVGRPNIFTTLDNFSLSRITSDHIHMRYFTTDKSIP